jgi:sugar/nucleoside kinase (ribokinase family)
MTYRALAQHSFKQIAERANRIGAFVASQSGALPLLPLEYRTL